MKCFSLQLKRFYQLMTSFLSHKGKQYRNNTTFVGARKVVWKDSEENRKCSSHYLRKWHKDKKYWYLDQNLQVHTLHILDLLHQIFVLFFSKVYNILHNMCHTVARRNKLLFNLRTFAPKFTLHEYQISPL